MGFLSRSYIATLRNCKRSLLLFIVFISVSLILAASWAFYHAVLNIERNLMRQFPPIAVIEWDPEITQIGRGPNMSECYITERPTTNLAEKIGYLPQVKRFEIQRRNGSQARNLRRVVPDSPLETPDGSLEISSSPGLVSYIRQRVNMLGFEGFDFLAVSNPIPFDFDVGLLSLSEGRFMTQEEIDKKANVVIISRAFANENHASVGTFLPFERHIHDQQAWVESFDILPPSQFNDFIIDTKEFYLEVIGIFEENIIFDHGNAINEFQSFSAEVLILNQLYIPLFFLESLYADSLDHSFSFPDANLLELSYFTQSFYLLHSLSDHEAFRLAANELLGGLWEIQRLPPQIEAIVQWLQTIRWISFVTLSGASLTAFLLFLIVIFYFVKNRRLEIGIYLSLGAKKITIAAQLMTEVFISFIAAMALALFPAQWVIRTLSMTFLTEGILHSESNQRISSPLFNYRNLFGLYPLPQENFTNFVENAFESSILMIYFSSGLGILVIAVIIPLIYFFKISPHKILISKE